MWDKKKVRRVADLTSASGDGQSESSAGLQGRSELLFGVGDTVFGKVLGPSQDDKRQAEISVEAFSKIENVENDESTQGK
jgi:hypothetical protein